MELFQASTRRRLLVLTAFAILGVAGTLSTLCSAKVEAQESASPAKCCDLWATVRQGRQLVGELRPPEAVEMLIAILTGRLGPGEGWFHPSESRYGWSWLARRYDKDGDGKLTTEELPARYALIRRLDRNRDESLTADDFDWSDRSAFARDSGVSGMWFRQSDKDSNGKLSRAEWNALFETAAKKKDFLTPADLREAFPLAPPKRLAEKGVAPPSGPSTFTLLKGLLSGEIGSLTEGPRLAQRAPDFALATQDGKRTVRLSEYRDKKPVVLIFGSFT